MKSQREEDILNYLESHEFLSTLDAMQMFGKSPASVRRDFTRLAENGLVRRVKGGIRALPRGSTTSIPFFLREQWFSTEKEIIAKKAAEFIPEGGVIFVHSGSTTLALGRYIQGGTVITDSLTLCELLRSRFPSGGPEVIILGGSVDLKGGVITGSRTEASIRDYWADVVFFSCRGMDDEGLLDTNDTIAASSRAMMDRARQVVMLADHSKFRRFGLSRLVPWHRINVLITSECPENAPMLERIESLGVQVHRVKGSYSMLGSL